VHLYEEHGADSRGTSTGCSPWRSGRRRARWSWRATGWAEAALLRRDPRRRPGLRSEPKASCWPTRAVGRARPRGLARYLFYEYVPAPTRSGRAAEAPPAHVWSGRGAASWRLLAAAPHVGAGARASTSGGRFWTTARRRGAASGGRRPREGLPVRRDRLVERRGGPGGAGAGGGRADLLHRLRRPELRRERPRAGRRPAPGDRPPRADLLGRDGPGPAAGGRLLARRALRRRLDPADAPAGAVRPRGGHRRLGGDGADELLAGYPTFAAERAAGLFRRLPRPGPVPGPAGRRPPAGRPRQHQPRLQAEAVPPRRLGPGGPGPPAVARLVLRPGDRRAPGPRRLPRPPAGRVATHAQISWDVEAEHLERAGRWPPGPTP
jgi:asparagine synthase (glutamine-hydrolysing)